MPTINPGRPHRDHAVRSARHPIAARRTLPCLVPLLGLSLSITAAAQQSPAPGTPTTPVAVENTNATFTPTDAQVPFASPARPTVSSPAHIPPVGYLQFEQGLNQASDSPNGTNAQFGLNQVTKIALTTRILVQFVTQPYAFSRLANPPTPDTTSTDPGDLLLGGQYIVHKAVGSTPVIALGYLRRVRTGTSADLDVGSYSQSALLLFSGDLPARLHYDANAIINEQNDGPARRAQFAQSISISRPLLEALTHGNLGIVAELSHTTQPLVHSSVEGVPTPRANAVSMLFAAVYSLRPNLVVDAAFSHGLTSTSTQWQGAFGFTYLLPRRLWPDRHPVAEPAGTHTHRTTR